GATVALLTLDAGLAVGGRAGGAAVALRTLDAGGAARAGVALLALQRLAGIGREIEQRDRAVLDLARRGDQVVLRRSRDRADGEHAHQRRSGRDDDLLLHVRSFSTRPNSTGRRSSDRPGRGA